MDQLARWGQLALAEEYRQLWDILCGALEQCARLLGEAAMELEEFALLFRLVLSQYDVGSIPVCQLQSLAWVQRLPRISHFNT